MVEEKTISELSECIIWEKVKENCEAIGTKLEVISRGKGNMLAVGKTLVVSFDNKKVPVINL